MTKEQEKQDLNSIFQESVIILRKQEIILNL